MKKSIFTKILCVMVAIASTFLFAGCGKEKDMTIKLGVSGPLTGDAAIYGQAVKNGAQLAIDEINAAGGLDGMKFSFDMLDDMHNTTKVENNYLELVDTKKVQISLGCVTSAPCLIFKNLAKEDNMFIMTPSATNDDVYKDASNVYQMCFSDNGQGTAAADFIKTKEEYKNCKVGVFYKTDDVYSKGIYEQFKARYETLADWNSVVVTSFTEDDTNFQASINSLKNCDFIFMPIYYQKASIFMQQAQGTIADDAVFFGCDGFDGIAGHLGDDLNNIAQKIAFLSHFDSNATTGKPGDFVTKYTETYGADTLNQFGASAYDCVYAIFEALKVAKENGKNFDGSTKPSAMCTILTEVLQNGTFTFTGVTGENIKWNANGTVDKLPLEYEVKPAN
ncbi:MAG: amino acid ABC transporter substrate-binding protein [Clostridiales bacterium]|nr:amino acid ABC transporter substrate-binding protein [Clostridiales bacterium]